MLIEDAVNGLGEAFKDWGTHLVHSFDDSYNSGANSVMNFGKAYGVVADATGKVSDAINSGVDAMNRRIANATGADKSIDTLGEAHDQLENTQVSDLATKGLYENRSQEDREAAETLVSTKTSVDNLLQKYGADAKFSQLEGADAEAVKSYFSPKDETGKELDEVQQAKSDVREARVRKAMIKSGVLDLYAGTQLQNVGKALSSSQPSK